MNFLRLSSATGETCLSIWESVIVSGDGEFFFDVDLSDFIYVAKSAVARLLLTCIRKGVSGTENTGGHRDTVEIRKTGCRRGKFSATR